jgi:hypothetical protein
LCDEEEIAKNEREKITNELYIERKKKNENTPRRDVTEKFSQKNMKNIKMQILSLIFHR